MADYSVEAQVRPRIDESKFTRDVESQLGDITVGVSPRGGGGGGGSQAGRPDIEGALSGVSQKLNNVGNLITGTLLGGFDVLRGTTSSIDDSTDELKNESVRQLQQINKGVAKLVNSLTDERQFALSAVTPDSGAERINLGGSGGSTTDEMGEMNEKLGRISDIVPTLVDAPFDALSQFLGGADPRGSLEQMREMVGMLKSIKTFNALQTAIQGTSLGVISSGVISILSGVISLPSLIGIAVAGSLAFIGTNLEDIQDFIGDLIDLIPSSLGNLSDISWSDFIPSINLDSYIPDFSWDVPDFGAWGDIIPDFGGWNIPDFGGWNIPDLSWDTFIPEINWQTILSSPDDGGTENTGGNFVPSGVRNLFTSGTPEGLRTQVQTGSNDAGDGTGTTNRTTGGGQSNQTHLEQQFEIIVDGLDGREIERLVQNEVERKFKNFGGF